MALVQSNSVNSTGSVTTLACAFTNPIGQGNMLVAFVCDLVNTTNTLSVSDSVNGSYNKDSDAGSVGTNGGLFTFPGVASGNAGTTPTVTAALTTASANAHLIIEEHSTVNTSSPLDQHTNYVGTNGTTSVKTGTTGTTAQANELVLVAVFLPQTVAATTLTAGGSFTNDPKSIMTSTASGRAALMYQYVTNGPATYTGQGTFGATVANSGGLIATYEVTPNTYTFLGQTVASSGGTMGAGGNYPVTAQTVTSAEGTPTAGVSTTLGTQTVTSSEGTITAVVGNAINVSLTGQTVTSTEGTLTAAVTNNATYQLSGLSISSAQGLIADQVSYLLDDTIEGITLVGQTLTSSQGTLAVTITYSPCVGLWVNSAGSVAQWKNAAGTPGVWASASGTELEIMSVAEGTPTVSYSTTLVGLALVSLEGQIVAVAPSNTQVALVGQTVTSAEGALTYSASYSVTAQTLTSAEGTITFSQSANQAFNLTGQTIVSLQGVLSLPVSIDEWLARSLLVNAGLIPVVQYNESGTVPAGHVISQSPAEGTIVPINSPVIMVVSRGPVTLTGNVTVPNLLGMLWGDATAALARIYLSEDKFIWQINAAPEGSVIAQSIAAGSSVPAGTIIQLTLSAGPTIVPTTVPVPQISA